MSNRPSRRDFLSTGAKIGAGAALAGTALGTAATRQAKAANVTLTYFGLPPNGLPNNPQIQMLKAFEATHPGVKTQYIPMVNQADDNHNKLVTVLSAHDGSIDIFDSDVIWQAQWAPAGWAVPLDKVFPPAMQKSYAPGMIWADTIGSHIYGIPWMLDTGHLFYRKDILDANGLKPATTWQELHDQGVMLAKKYPKMTPFVPCYYPDQQLICNFMELSWSNGGDLIDPKTGQITFNSPQNLQALEMMLSYVKDKLVPAGVASVQIEQGRPIFTQGNAIYHRNWNYAYGLSQANPALVGKVGVANIPVFPGHPTASCAGGWQYVVNPFSKNVELATELAVFLGSPKQEIQKTLLSTWSPAYLPGNYDAQVVKKFPTYPILAEQAKTERSRPKTPFWTNMSTVAQQELVNALIGKKTAQQALKDAQGKLEAILAGA